VASWRSLSQNSGAITVAGSPFKTLAEAEEACKAMLGYLGDAASWRVTDEKARRREPAGVAHRKVLPISRASLAVSGGIPGRL
jgi:hypothetical protein